MRTIAHSSFVAILTLICMGAAADSSQANFGTEVRTIPSPVPLYDVGTAGATFAEGMLIIGEMHDPWGNPPVFHKIDPVDGTLLETVVMPFNGGCGGIAYDGTHLWVIATQNWGRELVYEIGLDGSLISSFDPNLGDWWRPWSIAVDGDNLWIGGVGLTNTSGLFKLTKTGVHLEFYGTTHLLEDNMDMVIDTNYPTGSNLIVCSYKDGIQRLSMEGGSVSAVDECDYPSGSSSPNGLTFDGEFLWYTDRYASAGKIWCLDDGKSSSLPVPFIIEQSTNGGYNPWIKGQTFTPSVGIDPDPGTVSTLDLTAIRFYRSSGDWSGPTSHFYLNIYDGDPVNGSGVFVGSSTNTVDVDPLGSFDPMTWEFDYLTLDYNHEYWALVSSTNTDGGFDVYCGMRECGPDLYAGGTAIAGTSSDPGGYHVKGNDLAFQIGLKLSGPLPDIKVNGEDGPLFLTTSDTVTVTISLDPRNLDGDPADWWIYAEGSAPNTLWARYRNGQEPVWRMSATPIRFVGASLMSVNDYTVLAPRVLPPGVWEFGFAVDDNQDGVFDASFIDTVEVSVN